MNTEDYTFGRFNEDTVNKYGMGEKDERGYYSIRLFKFQLQPPERIDMDDDDTRLSLHLLCSTTQYHRKMRKCRENAEKLSSFILKFHRNDQFRAE